MVEEWERTRGGSRPLAKVDSMADPATSKSSFLQRSLAGFLRRHDMLPWLTGVSFFVAVAVAVWTVASADVVGFPGLFLVSGIALVCFIGFYALATGAFARPSGAEPALKTLHGRLSELGVLLRVLDQAPDAYLVTTRQGAVVYGNRAYGALTRSGNRGRNLGRPLPPEQVFAGDEDLAAPLYRLARAARAGRSAHEILRLKIDDGSERTYEGDVHRLDGDPDHAVWRFRESRRERGSEGGSILDHVADALMVKGEGEPTARAAGKGAILLDRAPVGVALLGADGAILEANPALETMARGAVAGVNIADLFVENRRDTVAKRLKRLRHGPPPPVKLEMPGGHTVQLHLCTLDNDPGGEAAAYLVDLSEQKSLEIQFAQSQKLQAVGQLAGGVAHDFNNLLTAIIGFCDLLLARHRVGDPSFDDIDQIRQNANRAANLVRQLLAFSRQQTLTPSVLSPTDVLSDLSMLLRRLLGETVELKLVHGRNLGLIKADRNQLETALINLAVNARDAMPEGGRLEIRSSTFVQPATRDAASELIAPGHYIVIEVADSGVGIPAENLDKIFEPFFTTKEVGRGTGLGLSTVYGIIKQMDGFVFPESEIGKGTTFRIYLPVHEGSEEDRKLEARPGANSRVPRDLTGMGTIMLVEDEDAVRAFAKRALTGRGYTVLEARNGEEALRMIEARDGPIDLLVSDVVMPEMDGPTLAAKMRDLRPETKIIFISGYAEDTFKKALSRPEELNFLPKPFSLKQLAAKVKEVLSA